MPNSTDGGSAQTQGQYVKDSLALYGPIFIGLLLGFSVVRPHWRLFFSPRDGSIPKIACELGKRKIRRFGWVVNAWKVSDQELLDQAGLDATALVRLLRLGIKVSAVGALQSIYLLPLYAMGGMVSTFSALSGVAFDCIRRLSCAGFAGGRCFFIGILPLRVSQGLSLNTVQVGMCVCLSVCC